MSRYPKNASLLSSLIITCSLLLNAASQAEETIKPGLIYHNYCSVCHGDKGDGKSHAESSMSPPPKDFTLQQTARGLTRERMIYSISKGLPGTAMVGWNKQLSKKEIEAVTDYIREIFMPAVGAGDVSRGKKLYTHTCSVCHGDDGRSAKWGSNLLSSRPRNFTTAESRQQLSRERMINSVTHGVKDSPMAAFSSQLNSDEIADVVDYIRRAFMQPDVTAGISGTRAHGKSSTADSHKNISNFSDMGVVNRRLLPKNENTPQLKTANMRATLPNKLKGNLETGHAMYLQNCVQCHGIKGDGEGPRAYFIFPRPRDFNRDNSRKRFNRPALYQSIAKGKLGTEMPAWDTVLTPQQIADISEYVFQSFIYTDSRNQATTK